MGRFNGKKITMDQEIWSTIENYPQYLVSNKGNVKSLSRKTPMPNNGYRIEKERILSARIGSHGYYYINLANFEGQKSFCIHRLVALAFVEPVEGKEKVNHKDGNKLNNLADNLEWATSGENNQHAYDTGLKIGSMTGKFGCENHSSKKVSRYSLSGEFLETYGSQREAQRKTGILQGNISAACNGVQETAGGFIWKKS